MKEPTSGDLRKALWNKFMEVSVMDIDYGVEEMVALANAITASLDVDVKGGGLTSMWLPEEAEDEG